MPAERDREMKPNYPALRRKSRHSYADDYADEGTVRILELSPEQQEIEFEKRWQQGGSNFQYAFRDIMESEAANHLAAEFVRRKNRQNVRDPKVAELLCPKDHPFSTKRLCVDSGYYETFNRGNVTLVDVRSHPIERITEQGLRRRDLAYVFDTLVLATGFDAIIGALLKIDIISRDGLSLRKGWADALRRIWVWPSPDSPICARLTVPATPRFLPKWSRPASSTWNGSATL